MLTTDHFIVPSSTIAQPYLCSSTCPNDVLRHDLLTWTIYRRVLNSYILQLNIHSYKTVLLGPIASASFSLSSFCIFSNVFYVPSFYFVLLNLFYLSFSMLLAFLLIAYFGMYFCLTTN